ncbi:MAG TPA: hypothetical protein PK528_12755 [Syntrophorhabdus sp.]|nr:hypothetical protein [Syntrophorhabdus sp.]
MAQTKGLYTLPSSSGLLLVKRGKDIKGKHETRYNKISGIQEGEKAYMKWFIILCGKYI